MRLRDDSQRVIAEPAALISSRNLFEMQVFGPHRGFTESETLQVKAQQSTF